MSRSGYSEDGEHVALWRGAVERALLGKRGQYFLQELAAALDAMPEKILIADELINDEGDCCAIGVVCKSRGIDVSRIDYDDAQQVAKAIGIAPSMAAEIVYMNDEWVTWGAGETPAQRWERMRLWVGKNLAKDEPSEAAR